LYSLYAETGVRPFGTERASDALVAALGPGPAWLKPTPSEMVCARKKLCERSAVTCAMCPVPCALCPSPPAERCAPRGGWAAHRMEEEFRRLGLPPSRNRCGRGHAQPRVDRAAAHALGNASRRHPPWQVCPPALGHQRATEASFSRAPDDPPQFTFSLHTRVAAAESLPRLLTAHRNLQGPSTGPSRRTLAVLLISQRILRTPISCTNSLLSPAACMLRC